MGVKYSINGFYFDYFGVHVSESKGLLDKLKPKERKSYDWKEYHGKQFDLSAPKYESREISLICWLKADNVQQLTDDFNRFLNEFDKSGNQRLLVEPFGYKPYVFDVFLSEKIELEKKFNQGEIFGQFTLTLIESNPIKKIFYLNSNTLELSFETPECVDINIDGDLDSAKGEIDFTQNLPNRNILEENNYGRNLFTENFEMYDTDFPAATERQAGEFKVLVNTNFNIYKRIIPSVKAKVGQKYSVSFEIKFDKILTQTKTTQYFEYETKSKENSLIGLPNNVWHKVFFVSDVIEDTTKEILLSIEGSGAMDTTIEYKNYKIEIGDQSTPYSVAPERQHFIVIAGNIDNITNLQTNAEVLWDKI